MNWLAEWENDLVQAGAFEATADKAMVRVSNVEEEPFRWVCSVVVTFPSIVRLPITGEVTERFFIGGAGVVISPQHVLTCGHILRGILGAKVIKPKRILVIPARKPGKSTKNRAPFGEWRVGNSWVNPKLFSSDMEMAKSHDYGLLRLQPNDKHEQLGHVFLPGNMLRYGWWDAAPSDTLKVFKTGEGQWLEKRRVNVAGYPGRKDRMYRGFNDVITMRPTGRLRPLMTYDVATTKGVSGGPIWLLDTKPKKRRTLVAIHIGKAGPRAVGRLITPTLIQFLRAKGVKSKHLGLS